MDGRQRFVVGGNPSPNRSSEEMIGSRTEGVSEAVQVKCGDGFSPCFLRPKR